MMNNGNSSETQAGLLSPLSEEDLTRLELALDIIGPQWGIAARLMSRLGLRVGEVARLTWANVTIYAGNGSTLRIPEEITKTGYARLLPIPAALTELLIEERHRRHARFFDEDQAKNAGETNPFFLAQPVIAKAGGKPATIRWFQVMITRTALATLGYKIKPHTLRHTFATRLLRETNIRVVQAALGHRSLRSTQIYTHPTMQDLRDAIQKTEGENK